MHEKIVFLFYFFHKRCLFIKFPHTTIRPICIHYIYWWSDPNGTSFSLLFSKLSKHSVQGLTLGQHYLSLSSALGQHQVRTTVKVEVTRFRFIFCVYNVSTKPTAFSSYVTVTLQEVVKQGFKFKDARTVQFRVMPSVCG